MGYRKHIRIDLAVFEQHLAGRQTLAVSAVKAECALFLAWDIDRLFLERLEILRDVFRKRDMSKCAFAIQGDGDRGKVVLTLASPISQHRGVALVREIAEEAQSQILFGTVGGDVTTFPNEGISAGNTVRLFGKNLKNPDPLLRLSELPLDIDGSLSDLWYLEPLKLTDTFDLAACKSTIHSRELMVLFTDPYRGSGDRIASDALKVAWRCGSGAEFDAWCDRLLAQTDLTTGVRNQLQREDFRRRTWAKRGSSNVVARPSLVGAWKAIPEPPTGLTLRSPAWRVYKAASDYAVRKGRNPHCFSITYGQWADLAGYASKPSCGKAVVDAEKANLLVRVDRGNAVLGGLPTLVAFVGDGETLQEAYDSAVTSDEFQERLKQRLNNNLPLNGNAVVNGRIVYAGSAPQHLDLADAA